MDVEEEHANNAVAGSVEIEEVDDGVLWEAQMGTHFMRTLKQMNIPQTQRRNRSANDDVDQLARRRIQAHPSLLYSASHT